MEFEVEKNGTHKAQRDEESLVFELRTFLTDTI